MSGGLRGGMRGEAGAVRASTVVLAALVLFFGYLLLAAFEGDTAEFGKVPVPGTEQVELPEGDVDIYYAESINPDAGVPLIVPDDLQYAVTGPNGEDVTINSRGDDAKSTGDGLTRLIGSLNAPADGSYTVATESSQAAQRTKPAVTFGQGPYAAIGKRFGDVVDALRGPAGIALAVVLLVLFLLPRYRAARRRASYRDQ